jgi:hypothetical protein
MREVSPMCLRNSRSVQGVGFHVIRVQDRARANCVVLLCSEENRSPALELAAFAQERERPARLAETAPAVVVQLRPQVLVSFH